MSSSALIVGTGSGLIAALAEKCREAGMEVANTSIIPSITNGNLNAPSLMIGETAAAMVPGARMARVAA